jgi:tetratricopeptide (TPR) repeat protein
MAGRVDDAFREFEAVSRVEPSNPEAWIGMGNVCLRKRDNASALKYFSTAAEQSPTNDEAQREMAIGLTHAHRYREALEHAEIAQRLGWKPFPSLDYLIKGLRYQIEHDPSER